MTREEEIVTRITNAIIGANEEIFWALHRWLGHMDTNMAQTAMRNQVRSICRGYREQHCIEPTPDSTIYLGINDDTNEIEYRRFTWQLTVPPFTRLEGSYEPPSSEDTLSAQSSTISGESMNHPSNLGSSSAQ